MPASYSGATENVRPRHIRDDGAVAGHELAALVHVPRAREHRLLVGALLVDGDVAVGAHAQVALVLEAQRPRGTGASDDGDLAERVLAVQLREQGSPARPRVQALEHLPPVVAVHEQPDDLRVAGEGTRVRMVGAQEDPPRIVDEQEELHAGEPHRRR